MADSSPAELKALLAEPDTTIATILQAGWEVDFEGSRAVFRNRQTRRLVEIPKWVLESISKACANTHRETQREIRQAIGLE